MDSKAYPTPTFLVENYTLTPNQPVTAVLPAFDSKELTAALGGKAIIKIRFIALNENNFGPEMLVDYTSGQDTTAVFAADHIGLLIGSPNILLTAYILNDSGGTGVAPNPKPYTFPGTAKTR